MSAKVDFLDATYHNKQVLFSSWLWPQPDVEEVYSFRKDSTDAKVLFLVSSNPFTRHWAIWPRVITHTSPSDPQLLHSCQLCGPTSLFYHWLYSDPREAHAPLFIVCLGLEAFLCALPVESQEYRMKHFMILCLFLQWNECISEASMS